MELTEKAEQGDYPHYPPVGYLRNENGDVVKDEVYAPLVVKLFELTVKGHYSPSKIADMLFQLGLRNPHKGENNGERMTFTTLKRVIANPFYYGIFIWKEKLYPGNHEPIISKALWDRANAALRDENRPYNKDETDYYLSGLCKCYECKRSVTGAYVIKNPKNPEKAKKYRYYRCGHQKDHKIKGYISEEDYADKVLFSVVKAVHIPKDITNILQKTIDIIAEKQTFIEQNKRDILQDEYDNSLKQMNRLYDLHIKGKTNNLEMFERKEKELNETIIGLKNELALCNTDEKKTVQKAKALFFFINELEQVYKESSYEDKALIIKEICGISILKGREVIPNYHEPFNTLSRINQEIKEKSLTITKLTQATGTTLNSCSKNVIRGRRDLNPRSLP
ncbi:MAG: recombinase family protein [Endomicrobium sp.]|nr:recombinase family protein [Endomicrobium sp.]